MAGPFQDRPFYPFRVPPLGLVPKKTLGEFRLIHHLSYPRGSSVNDGISPAHTSISYATISMLFSIFQKASGPGCFLVKTDIKNAFRIIPIRPEDYGLLGMRWRDSYYYELSIIMPIPVAFISRPFLLSRHSHSTRKDMWSIHYAVIC